MAVADKVKSIIAEQLGIPEYIAYHLIPVVHKINVMLLIGIPPIFLLLILWGIILSHRFEGPIERVKREVEKISESGDYRKRIHLRKHDDIKPIVDSINRLLDSFSKKCK